MYQGFLYTVVKFLEAGGNVSRDVTLAGRP